MNKYDAVMFIDHLLKKNLSIEDITDNLKTVGLIINIFTGDDIHATYAIFPKSKSYFLHITKCSCGYIHHLEDMCNKCHQDWHTHQKDDKSNVNIYPEDDGLPF